MFSRRKTETSRSFWAGVDGAPATGAVAECNEADNLDSVTDAFCPTIFWLDNPSTCKLKASDVNGDGRVTVTDQVLVQRAAAGLEDSRTFRCPSPIQFGPLTKF